MVRILAASFICFLGLSVRAGTLTDLWYNPAESGWGVNLIEQDGTVFATLFVYGTDGRATWYVGPAMTLSGTSYTGTFYSTQGPAFSGAFNPSQVSVRPVGTISFTPNGSSRGTLAYSVDGTTVMKAVERQTWRRISMAGTYLSVVDLRDNEACGLTGVDLRPEVVTVVITETPDATGIAGSVRWVLTDSVGGGFTFNGTYRQSGATVEADGTGAIQGVTLNAAVRDMVRDDNTVRGEFRLVLPGNCTQRYRFAGVRDD